MRVEHRLNKYVPTDPNARRPSEQRRDAPVGPPGASDKTKAGGIGDCPNAARLVEHHACRRPTAGAGLPGAERSVLVSVAARTVTGGN